MQHQLSQQIELVADTTVEVDSIGRETAQLDKHLLQQQEQLRLLEEAVSYNNLIQKIQKSFRTPQQCKELQKQLDDYKQATSEMCAKAHAIKKMKPTDALSK